MAIRFANGFGIGSSNGGGNGISPYWTDNTNGYTQLTGGMTATDDGYSINPIILPYVFYQGGSSGTDLYVSTNGVISLNSGYDNCCPGTPQDNSNLFSGNPGDMMLVPGLGMSDGTTQGIWYRITDYGQDIFKVEIKVFNSELGNANMPMSYQINLYRNGSNQWMESWCRFNLSTYGSPSRMGPYNVSDVSVIVSKTRQVWRSDLNGQNWELLGNIVVPFVTGPTPTPTDIPAPTPTPAPLSQFTPNGTAGSNGLITFLDYTTGINASNHLPDQSGASNEFAYAGSNPYTNGVTGYTFTGSGSYAYAVGTNASYYNLGFSQMSFEMWVKIPTIQGGQSLISAGGNSAGGWALRVDGAGSQLNLVKYNIADQTANLPYTLQANTWYHIAVLQGGTSLTYMINGEIVGATNSAAPENFNFPNGTINIAKDYYTNTNYAMSLGYLKVYDYCLTASDVTTEFNSTKTGYGY